MDTTSSLLKQAREVLWDAAQELHHIDSGPIKELGGVIAKVEDAAAALTAFDSLSEYDKAIHALAPYLPDGWVAKDGHKQFVLFGEKPTDRQKSLLFHTKTALGEFYGLSLRLKVPDHSDWRKSLRHITHNSDGTVTVERG